MLARKVNINSIFLIRHGHRPPIPHGSLGNEIKLSKEGQDSSYNLGQKLKHIEWRNIYTSPLERCVETASFIVKGLDRQIKIDRSAMLGDPGPFIIDSIKASSTFLENSLHSILQKSISSQLPSGMRSLREGAELFLSYLNTIDKLPCLMISHDSIIALLYAYFFKSLDINTYIPDFLEGMVITKKSDGYIMENQEKMVFLPT